MSIQSINFKIMKSCLTILFFCTYILLRTEDLNAGHIVGYDLSLINIKTAGAVPTDQYKFRLKYYRDINGTNVPQMFTFSIKENNTNTEIRTVNLLKVNPYTLIQNDPTSCAPPDLMKLEYALYESEPIDFNNLSSSAGYYIYTSSFARNEGIKNVDGNSSGEGIIMTMDFTVLNNSSQYRYNSSPEFNVFQADYYCLNSLHKRDFSCIDIDNDSLVYSLVQPLAGGNLQSSKPFPILPYAQGYSLNNILDGNPKLSIDSVTGELSFNPTQEGIYLIAIKVEEYRNNIKIGEIRKEFEVETVECAPQTKPSIQYLSSNEKNIFTTVHVGQTLNMLFKATDSEDEDFKMEIVPTSQSNDSTANIFDPRNGALWGKNIDSLKSSADVILGETEILGYLRWTPDCFPAREQPYTFMIIASDFTCPTGLADTLYVSIIVTGNMTNPLPTISFIADTLSVANIYDSYQWYIDNIKINGATSHTHIANYTGGYFVRVGNNNLCPVNSNLLYIVSTSTENNTSKQEVVYLYPNPTFDMINIKMDNKIKRVVLFDLMGKILMDEIETNIKAVSLLNLESGIYLIRIEDTNGTIYNEKIVKE